VRFPNRITHLLYFSSTSTIQVEQEPSGTRVAILLVMNGVSL